MNKICEKFKVKVKLDDDDYYGTLSITHNGYQWQTISLCNEGEMITLILALEKAFLTEGKPTREEK